MDWQIIINIVAGASLSGMGWFARQLWDAVQKLKDDMSKLELSVSDNYVKKSDVHSIKVDINTRFDRLEMLMDKVYDKLDNKADR